MSFNLANYNPSHEKVSGNSLTSQPWEPLLSPTSPPRPLRPRPLGLVTCIWRCWLYNIPPVSISRLHCLWSISVQRWYIQYNNNKKRFKKYSWSKAVQQPVNKKSSECLTIFFSHCSCVYGWGFFTHIIEFFSFLKKYLLFPIAVIKTHLNLPLRYSECTYIKYLFP